jgi:hypothetical protein
LVPRRAAEERLPPAGVIPPLTPILAVGVPPTGNLPPPIGRPEPDPMRPVDVPPVGGLPDDGLLDDTPGRPVETLPGTERLADEELIACLTVLTALITRLIVLETLKANGTVSPHPFRLVTNNPAQNLLISRPYREGKADQKEARLPSQKGVQLFRLGAGF